MSKPLKSKAQEALEFLDDLEDFSDLAPAEEGSGDDVAADAGRPHHDDDDTEAASASSAAGADEGKEAEDALKFLNDLTQKSSSSARPLTGATSAATTPKPASKVPSPAPPAAAAAAADAPAAVAAAPAPADEPLNIPSSTGASGSMPSASSGGGGGGWGWSAPSLWSTASSALSTARSHASSLQRETSSALSSTLGDVAAELQPRESVGKVGEDVRGLAAGLGGWGGGLGGLRELVEKGREVAGGVDLEKLRHDLLLASQSGLTNLLATIAPPIAEHEVLEVVLSSDMAGYEGVEGVVYRALAKILEQVEGGELVVSSAPPTEPAAPGQRDMRAVEGWAEALRVAEAAIAALVEAATAKPAANKESADLPVHVTPVYLRIQPVLHASPFANPSSPPPAAAAAAAAPADQLSFLLHLADPAHALTHTIQTQPVPTAWLAVPWETNGWVEERLVDALRVGIECVGEGYVMERMGVVGGVASAAGRSAAASGSATPAQAAGGAADAGAEKKE